MIVFYWNWPWPRTGRVSSRSMFCHLHGYRSI
uniref:Uncharacterized protein n=1 Tax=Arundo donax TaxID=35708 RepID=A0A0A9FGD7_ARUDO